MNDRHRASPHLRLAWGTLVAVAITVAPGAASADDRAEASAAYGRGAQAFAAKRYAEAAVELGRADALAPNDVALTTALQAAELAEAAALGMTLVERAEARTNASERLTSAAGSARSKLAGRAGKLLARCGAAERCTVRVDAEPFPVGQPRWVKVGAHVIDVDVGAAAAAHQTLNVEAERLTTWDLPETPAPKPEAPKPPPAAPAPVPPPVSSSPPPAPSAPATGISPAWFAVGASLTAVAGGFLVASALDAQAKHDAYLAYETNDASAGRAAQTRTNVLVGVTAGVGVATTAIGLFAVRWSSSPSSTAAVRHIEVRPTLGSLTVGAAFE